MIACERNTVLERDGVQLLAIMVIMHVLTNNLTNIVTDMLMGCYLAHGVDEIFSSKL